MGADSLVLFFFYCDIVKLKRWRYTLEEMLILLDVGKGRNHGKRKIGREGGERERGREKDKEAERREKVVDEMSFSFLSLSIFLLFFFLLQLLPQFRLRSGNIVEAVNGQTLKGQSAAQAKAIIQVTS